uniref:Protein EFR3 homolog B-like n=1 Tax=Phallusia mammillata TaxID=59560 RepID=A0A6F9DB33_9ASCI|nr:protein EFR3 homolog B-like [Phallusia mammillata]
MASCSCCPAFRPRYKRLVDNIFPSVQSEGLVRSEMEKLTYYAVSAPEKLDRIGDYLARRLTRDIARKRDQSVFVAMEALNQLLLACHAQQINLFVESFLKMVATLLESDNYNFQALGTNSFEKFSKIEEDTASYHRRYDFFVSKFSAMCHSNEENLSIRRKIQLHGVHGLRGVIRKTVSDELQVNIWEKQHMDKIIPSLLYSMQNSQEKNPSDAASDVEQPSTLAEESLRELLSRAAFSNVSAAIYPALAHMDNHELWAPDNSFAIKSFKIIMYSIQGQYSHVIVKLLLDHIDTHDNNDQPIRASILKVLCAIVPIPASTAIGPSVIDVFNRLSQHLRISAESTNQKTFQTALIETTGVLSSVVPDYQKLEAMSFYINRALEAISDHDLREATTADLNYSSLLLQCIQQISKTYRINTLSSLSSSLLEPLLKITLNVGPNDRLIAQNVLLVLLDKNNNRTKLKLVNSESDIDQLGLVSSTASKQDCEFLDQRLHSIYLWLYECFTLEDNSTDNFQALYKLVSVLCLSVMSADVILELCRIVLAAQNSVVENSGESFQVDSNQQTMQLLSSTAACILVLAHLSAVPEFQHYANQVMLERNSVAPQIMPSFTPGRKRLNNTLLDSSSLSKIVFSSTLISDSLRGRGGFNVEKLSQPLASYQIDTVSADGHRGPVDIESINIEFPINKEAPSMTAVGVKPVEAITYQYFKQLLNKPPISRKEQIEINSKVAEHIKSVPFEQLMAERPPDPCVITRNWINQVREAEDFTTEDDDGLDALHFPSIYAY